MTRQMPLETELNREKPAIRSEFFLQNITLLLARFCFSLLFVIAGIGKITDFQGTTEYLSSVGLHAPEFFLVLAILFELGGSLMILLGWKTRIGAALICIFVIMATIIVHNFWAYPAPDAQNQVFHFMKNITIFGGALYIMATGAGAYSIDGRKKRR